jgi:hypothetical protein
MSDQPPPAAAAASMMSDDATTTMKQEEASAPVKEEETKTSNGDAMQTEDAKDQTTKTEPLDSDAAATASDTAAPVNQDEDVCEICFSGDIEDDNLIVYCDGTGADGKPCSAIVHQWCYGVFNIPEGDDPWSDASRNRRTDIGTLA